MSQGAAGLEADPASTMGDEGGSCSYGGVARYAVTSATISST